MKVYIITTGEYSDYCIDNVFADKHKAEIYCATHNNVHRDDYRIEEYETYDDKLQGDVPIYKRICVWGENFVRKNHYSSWLSDQNDTTFSLSKDGSFLLTFSVQTDASEDKINKIIQDKLAECKEKCQYDFKDTVTWEL